jgi:type IV pilus assembly protein PilW
MKSLNMSNTARPASGFTLVELMVAIALGILLSVGLVTLFGATSKTNRVQDAMAQLQENGRYAMTRLNNDLRLVGHQTLNVAGFANTPPGAAANPDGIVDADMAADVYVATINLPDFAAAGLSAPAGWPAATPWPLSQRYYLQGYECSTGTCAPLPATGTSNDLPVIGTTAGTRLGTADVMSVRYMNSNGWSLSRNELAETTSAGTTCTGGSLATLTVTPYAGNTSVTPNVPPGPAFNFGNLDLVMLVTGSRAEIFQVTVAGNTLIPVSVVGGTVPCFPTTPSAADVQVFNFSKDFVTVTYYVKLDADANDATRVIPVLVRRQSNVVAGAVVGSDQELVQGVEQLDFLVGIERGDAKVSYLTADLVAGQSSYANCPPEPAQYSLQMPVGTVDPECMWRAVKSIEARVLMNSINNLFDLIDADMAYQYTYNYDGTDNPQLRGPPAAPTVNMPSGIKAGKMLRREFVSMVSIRNYNP